MIVVPVLIANCQVSEYRNAGPATSHPRMTNSAAPNAHGAPTICATSNIMGLIEHEVPEHGLVHLLELRNENLEIVEVQISEGSPVAGKRVERLEMPDGARLISVTRDGQSEIAVGATELLPGDQVLAILQPGKEDELRRVLLKK